MIRKSKEEDREIVLELWLETNCSAHDFIARDYWKNHYDLVKEMMSHTLIYVYEEKNVIQGFIGLMEDHIVGLFVSSHLQSQGIGKQLLDEAKHKNETLSLHVYQKNERAVDFYLREGFFVVKEQVEENTGQIEFSMNWIK